MPSDKAKQDLRKRCGRVRADILFLLDWIEAELDKENDIAPAASEPLTDRHHWILGQLREGLALTREMVEREFGIGERQAKRTIASLCRRGLVEFARKPKPGHYILRCRSSSRGTTGPLTGCRSKLPVSRAPACPELRLFPPLDQPDRPLTER